MPSNIYTVKQAAKILGLSTNTTYKYLNEGRIKAARGHLRGTFIITAKSLENFLGSKLPENPLDSPDAPRTNQSFPDAEAIIEVSPPTFATKVVRILLAISLVLIILDLLLSKDFSPVSAFVKVFLLALVFLVSYQFGGFVKK
jgi:excisionase family DNA binding protein